MEAMQLMLKPEDLWAKSNSRPTVAQGKKEEKKTHKRFGLRIAQKIQGLRRLLKTHGLRRAQTTSRLRIAIKTHGLRTAHMTRAEMKSKDTRVEKRTVGTRAEKRPVVARAEKRAANGSNYNANSSQNQTMTRFSAKGKEKINSPQENSNFMTQREEKMQHGCRTEHEYYRRGTAQPQQKDTQSQVMEPPDKGILMEGQTDLGEEGDSMMDTHNPEEEMMVEEGDALMESTG